VHNVILAKAGWMCLHRGIPVLPDPKKGEDCESEKQLKDGGDVNRAPCLQGKEGRRLSLREYRACVCADCISFSLPAILSVPPREGRRD